MGLSLDDGHKNAGRNPLDCGFRPAFCYVFVAVVA